MAYLIVLRDHVVTDRCELTGPVTIGRAPDCDVVVLDAKASRHHCVVEPTPDEGWRVRDLGSRNGILKGEQLITESSLAGGDVVWLGENVCLQFGEGDMPRRRPKQPHEALELARVGGSEDKLAPEPSIGPRPMPRAWGSSSEASPADASAVSTDLNFGKQSRTSGSAAR